jgi:beta-lactamase class A
MNLSLTLIPRAIALLLAAAGSLSAQAAGPADSLPFGSADEARMALDAEVDHAAGHAGTLALDTSSLTTDQSINTPTAWWTYVNQTPAQVSELVNSLGARITEIQVESLSGGEPRLAVRLVKNSGAYAATGGWWWYYGLTTAQITSHLNANSARLIDVEPYDIGGGNIRYAVVMVSNTGSAARSWWYLTGASSADISAQTAQNRRLIDLDSFVVGGVRKYSAVFVANTGADNKAWQYFYGQTTAGISAKVSAFAGRIVKLDRQSDGTYNFVQVKNTGSDNSAWWHQYGFSSMTALNNFSNQLASRPVTITSYLNSSGQRRYDAAYIDNANSSTRRMRGVYGATFLDSSGNPTRGIFEAYLRQVGSSTLVDLNSRRAAETASALKALHLLHSMKQVQLGSTTLGSAFTYYNYPDGSTTDASDRCPNPIYEVAGNKMTNYNFEGGLDEMMAISDNRTTRGVVLRYGMPALNTTGSAAGLTSTAVRHNIGCAYINLSTGKYDPTNLRNNTSAYDLARIYESVWLGTSLTNTNSARSEFLESANPKIGAYSSLQTIINAEAASLGKPSTVATAFGAAIRRWSKGGSYGTCLPDANGDCGQKVTIRSSGGLIELPFKASGLAAPRVYSYANLISDVPVTCWEDGSNDYVDCPSETNYVNAYSAAQPELFREIVRAGLATW